MAASLPCPFCCSSDVGTHQWHARRVEWCVCANCGARGPTARFGEAESRWDQRITAIHFLDAASPEAIRKLDEAAAAREPQATLVTATGRQLGPGKTNSSNQEDQ